MTSIGRSSNDLLPYVKQVNPYTVRPRNKQFHTPLPTGDKYFPQSSKEEQRKALPKSRLLFPNSGLNSEKYVSHSRTELGTVPPRKILRQNIWFILPCFDECETFLSLIATVDFRRVIFRAIPDEFDPFLDLLRFDPEPPEEVLPSRAELPLSRVVAEPSAFSCSISEARLISASVILHLPQA